MSVDMRVSYPDSKPDGVVSIERDGASGHAIAFPRQLCAEICQSNEYKILQWPCVYVLWSPGAHNQKPMAYVGESDSFAQRISGHYDTKKFWTRAVVYSDEKGHLSKTHALQIESWLVEEAQKAQVCDLQNRQNRHERAQNKTVAAASVRHFDDLRRFFLPLAGCDFFRQRNTAVQTIKDASVAVAAISQSRGLLFLRESRRGIKIEAQGRETDEGFLVYAGSQASKDEIPTYRQEGHGFERQVIIRDDLIGQKILVDDGNVFRFAQDCPFRSSWYALTVILGTNGTAKTMWKDAEGRTLGELQKE
ncbi:MAG: GIY-YIG nuclease family protein [Gammaproteobacteria bacterium]